jgi:hypothetical protein
MPGFDRREVVGCTAVAFRVEKVDQAVGGRCQIALADFLAKL